MAHMNKLEMFKSESTHAFGFFSLMTVGVLLAWVMVAGIIDTTVFQRHHAAGLVRMFFIVGTFGLVFSHKYLMRAAIAVLTCGVLFLVSGFLFTPVEPNLANQFVAVISSTLEYITGERAHNMMYETLIIWSISLFFGFFVVFFSYHKFHFWVLFPVSVVTTSVAITSSYFQEDRIFYTYVFCLLVLVVKHLYEKNRSQMANPPKTAIFAKLIIPLTASIVLLASLIPTPPEGFSEGFMGNIIRAPFDFINDIFSDVTQQSEFSLRQIGFGESGGRLGGDVAPNDGVFMQIRTNLRGPLYLTGLTRDMYTGYSWINSYHDYHAVDFGVFDQNLESLERVMGVNQLLFLYPFIEAVEVGNLVQIEPTFYHIYGFDYDDDHLLVEDEHAVWRVFIDEETGGEFWISDDDIERWAEQRIFRDETTGVEIWASPDRSNDWVVHDLDAIYAGDFMGRISINNLDRRLTTLFHTGIVQNIEAHSSLSLLRNREGRFLFEERLLPNTTYTIFYRDIDFSQTESTYTIFYHNGQSWYEPSILELSYRGILQDVLHMLESFRENYGYHIPTMSFDILSYEDLLERYLIPRADQIHDIYTALPDDFPDRVGELALEVTAGATNNYEKMRLLESFLSEGFAYTLTPGASPRNQDFVDHFLFDLQQGYCVHFATAFVTMARSLEMPTRYVEGFFVNLGTRQALDIDVLNSMAHAWPEVYFEGHGWVRFEPTPSSGLPQFQGGDSSDSSTVGGHFPDIEGPEEPDYTTVNGGADISTPDRSGSSGGQQLVEENKAVPVWVWVGLPVLLITMLIFIRVMIIRLKHGRISKNENSELAIYRFKVLLTYLKLLGFDIRETETVIQFATRIQRYYTRIEHERELLKSAVAVFTKARYSTQEITEADCEVLAKLIHRMDHRMRDDLGKGKYLFYRYILAKV